MPLKLPHTTRPNRQVLLALIRSRFARTARVKADRDRARAVVAALIGVPSRRPEDRGGVLG